MLNYFEQAYPACQIEAISPSWNFTSLQMGAYSAIPFHDWKVELEFLLGYGRVHAPFLQIKGENKAEENRLDLVILRGGQIINVIALTPGVSLKRNFKANTYWLCHAAIDMYLQGDYVRINSFPKDLGSMDAGSFYFPSLTFGFGKHIGQ